MRELYLVPSSWLWVTLQDVAEVVTGNTPPTSAPENYGGKIPFIKPPQLNDTPIGWSPETLSEKGLEKARLLPPKSVLVSCIGILGKTAITKTYSATNQQINAVVFEPPLQPEYGFYYAQTLAPWLKEYSSATTVSIINKSKFAAAPFPLPPAAEQTRIVTKLEELLTDLDAGVAELKTAQKKLAQYRQSLLKAAVEGALTAQWREDNPATESGAQLLERILQERRARWEAKQLAKFAEQGKMPPKEWQKKYPEPVQPDTTDLPPLPEGWVWASVQLLGDVQLGRQRSPEKMKGISPTPYIRAANITEAGIDLDDVLEMDFSEQERNVFQLQAGDVLLTEASGSAEHVGRPAIWPNIDGLYCFQNTVLRFKPQCVSSEFAFYSFLAMQKLGVFSKLSGGVGINHLSAGKFSKLPIALPASSEQAVIVKTLKSQLAGVEEQHLAIALALNQSVAQRQNILRAAFSGQLVPQDPTDEPASVLLERIRAQRAVQAPVKKARGRRGKEAT